MALPNKIVKFKSQVDNSLNDKNNCPWILKENVYNKNGTKLYDISHNPDKILTLETINELNKKDWIMKVSEDNRCRDEINIINELKLYDCSYCINFPRFNYYRYGQIYKSWWYVLEKYDSSISKDLIYCQNNIKQLGFQIISFFEWLHLKGKVHGDVKSDNIVLRKRDNSFRMIDFESVKEPTKHMCYEDLPNGYYYYGLGCEYDKPNFSYRMDLESFGFILWNILLYSSEVSGFSWQRYAFNLYNKGKTSNYFNALETEKKYNLLEKEKPEIIEKYFSIISKSGWFDKYANPHVYIELKNLFC